MKKSPAEPVCFFAGAACPSSHEIVSLQFLKNLAGPPVYYNESNEPSLAPKIRKAGKYL
jgi:hypothetical protein